LLMIWIYKYLLGTLPLKEVERLKQELKERYHQCKTRTGLELKLHTAFTVDRPTKKYLAELLDDWEKRYGG